MKYSVSHKFQIDADRFFKYYFDDAYNQYLDERLRIKERRLLSEKEDEKTIVKEHLVFPDRKIPKALRVLVGERVICYTEKRTLYKNSNELTFSIVAGILKGKIHCQGTFKIKSSGDNSIIRVAEGELTVNIPIIGKLAEKFIVKEILKSFTQSAELAKEYFKKHP